MEGSIVFASFGPERTDVNIDGELYAIYILSEYIGKGIGTQLLKEGAKEMYKLGYSSLLVWVLELNPSKFFYEKLDGERYSEEFIQIAGEKLLEVSYIWRNLSTLKG